MNPVQTQLSHAVQTVTEASEPWMPKPPAPPEKPWDGSVSDLLEKGRSFLSELSRGSFWKPRSIWATDRRPSEENEEKLKAAIEALSQVAIARTPGAENVYPLARGAARNSVDDDKLPLEAIETLALRGLNTPFHSTVLLASRGLLAVSEIFPERLSPKVIAALRQWQRNFSMDHHPWEPPYRPIRDAFGIQTMIDRNAYEDRVPSRSAHIPSAPDFFNEQDPKSRGTTLSGPNIRVIDNETTYIEMARANIRATLINLITPPTIHRTAEPVRTPANLGARGGAAIMATITELRSPIKNSNTMTAKSRSKISNTERMIRFWLDKVDSGYTSPEKLPTYVNKALDLSRKPGIHLELVRQVNRTYFAVHGQAPQRVPHRYIQTRMSGVRQNTNLSMRNLQTKM